MLNKVGTLAILTILLLSGCSGTSHPQNQTSHTKAPKPIYLQNANNKILNANYYFNQSIKRTNHAHSIGVNTTRSIRILDHAKSEITHAETDYRKAITAYKHNNYTIAEKFANKSTNHSENAKTLVNKNSGVLKHEYDRSVQYRVTSYHVGKTKIGIQSECTPVSATLTNTGTVNGTNVTVAISLYSFNHRFFHNSTTWQSLPKNHSIHVSQTICVDPITAGRIKHNGSIHEILTINSSKRTHPIKGSYNKTLNSSW